MSVDRVRRWGTGVGLAGGAAVAAAAVLGLGTAQAAPADDGAGTAVTIASAAGSDIDGFWLLGDPTSGGDTDTTTGSSVDLLSTAVTNFTDANTLLSNMDVSDAPSQLPQVIDAQTGMLDTVVHALNDYVGPGESAILAHSGSLSGLVDQLFFDPLNQNWVDASEALLTADQALDTAVASGSESDIVSALLQGVGVEFSQVLPSLFESVPVIIFGGGVAGDAAAGATTDLFDLPF